MDPESFYGGHVSCDGCRRNRGSAGDLPERKNAGKAFSEDEEDEVLFLHQGNDERENLPWRREKKEGYLSPNMRIRRKYKNDQKAGKYQPTGAETPAELEERNELSGDGMRRLHDGYEKARYSREGCTKEEAEALRN